MSDPKLMKWNCSAEIFSYSHKLDKNVLDEWNEKLGKKLDSPIFFHYKDESVFIFHFYLPEKIDIEKVEVRAIMLGSSMMMALNLAEPGAHIWWPPAIWPVKFNLEHRHPKIALAPVRRAFPDRNYNKDKFILDRQMLRRATLIWPVIIKLEEKLFFHYIKAMNLLSSIPTDFDFYEEIFLDFWKALERFMAVEYLKNKKTLNKKTMKRCLASEFPSDFWQEIESDFDKLYKLRGSTAAHSFGKEKRITFEEAGKVKVFTDFFLYRVLRARADKKMAELLKPEEPTVPKG